MKVAFTISHVFIYLYMWYISGRGGGSMFFHICLIIYICGVSLVGAG